MYYDERSLKTRGVRMTTHTHTLKIARLQVAALITLTFMQMTYVAPSYSAALRPPGRRGVLTGTGSSRNEVDARDHQASLYGGFDAARFQKPKVSRLFSRTYSLHEEFLYRPPSNSREVL